MPIDWERDQEEEARRVFELAALEAAQGYVDVLDRLNDALQREAKLKAQIAALIGIGA